MTIITTTPEHRQSARVLTFPPALAPYIEWNHIGQTAIELGAQFDVRRDDHGETTITFFWSYTEAEVAREEIRS